MRRTVTLSPGRGSLLFLESFQHKVHNSRTMNEKECLFFMYCTWRRFLNSDTFIYSNSVARPILGTMSWTHNMIVVIRRLIRHQPRECDRSCVSRLATKSYYTIYPIA